MLFAVHICHNQFMHCRNDDNLYTRHTMNVSICADSIESCRTQWKSDNISISRTSPAMLLHHISHRSCRHNPYPSDRIHIWTPVDTVESLAWQFFFALKNNLCVLAIVRKLWSYRFVNSRLSETTFACARVNDVELMCLWLTKESVKSCTLALPYVAIRSGWRTSCVSIEAKIV